MLGGGQEGVRDGDSDTVRHGDSETQRKGSVSGTRVLPSGRGLRGGARQPRAPLLSGREIRRKRLISRGCLGSRGVILLLGAFFPHRIILGSFQGPVPGPGVTDTPPQDALSRRAERSAKALSHSLSQALGLALLGGARGVCGGHEGVCLGRESPRPLGLCCPADDWVRFHSVSTGLTRGAWASVLGESPLGRWVWQRKQLFWGWGGVTADDLGRSWKEKGD